MLGEYYSTLQVTRPVTNLQLDGIYVLLLGEIELEILMESFRIIIGELLDRMVLPFQEEEFVGIVRGKGVGSEFD